MRDVKASNHFISAAFLVISILSLAASACASKNPSSSSPTPYWFQDSSGGIQTNDAIRLQKEVTFTIIFPSYLPAELKSNPPALFKSSGKYRVDDIEVKIQYSSKPKSIQIEEVNSDLNWSPSGDREYAYWVSVDTKVLEEKTTEYVAGVGQPVQQIVFYEMWNKGNVSFSAIVTGYEQAQSRKAVESMIRQGS